MTYLREQKVDDKYVVEATFQPVGEIDKLQLPAAQRLLLEAAARTQTADLTDDPDNR